MTKDSLMRYITDKYVSVLTQLTASAVSESKRCLKQKYIHEEISQKVSMQQTAKFILYLFWFQENKTCNFM